MSTGVLALCAAVSIASPAAAQSQNRGMGIRVGVGTDVGLGVAAGLEINSARTLGTGVVELGLLGFGGHFTEDTEDGCCSYHETTNIIVGAALANYLLGYDAPGPYFVFGVGVGLISVSYREESPDDTSLGPPLSGGGSYLEEDGAVAGSIINVGIGKRISKNADVRLQLPTFFISSGAAGSVIPTLTLSVGFRL